MKEVYRVTTQDGASTLACGEHLWSVKTAEDRRRGQEGRGAADQGHGRKPRAAHAHATSSDGRRRYSMPQQSVPLDPYALGLLLGDGCLTTTTTPSFATNDPSWPRLSMPRSLRSTLLRKSEVDYILRRTRRHTWWSPDRQPGHRHPARPRTGRHALAHEVRPRDLSGRTAKQSGWLSCRDSWTPTVGPCARLDRTCRVQYTTCSDKLRDDVIFLVRSMGGVAYSRTRQADGRKPWLAKGRPVLYRHDAHVIDIRLPDRVGAVPAEAQGGVYDNHGGGRPDALHRRHRARRTSRKCVCISVGAAGLAVRD